MLNKMTACNLIDNCDMFMQFGWVGGSSRISDGIVYSLFKA